MQADLITKILEKYFEFDRIFILKPYGISLDGLKEDLMPLCREKYNNNYRFVFWHYDTDYHITNDQPGLMLRNLQKILYSLDISNFFCLIVTQKDLTNHLEMLRVEETADDVAIACLRHPLQEDMHFDKIPVDLNSHNVIHNYMSLNRVKRFHRTLLYAHLKAGDLLKHGAVSYGARQDD